MAKQQSTMEGLEIDVINEHFWKNKKVFVTGHTGFKGSWLCLWLNSLGAQITGYALQPSKETCLYNLSKIDQLVTSVTGDIRNAIFLRETMLAVEPDIVIHMAAQPLVRESYKDPIETYSTNVMGTVHVLESVRACRTVKAVLNVTTDKCYENKEWVWGYRENEPMGGYDPYSNSKACSELVTAAYRNSFFNPNEYLIHSVGLATARAGNVIGGGDWAGDRLIPDCIESLLIKQKITIRNPNAVRPWQYVLEPLSGYLLLAQRLYEDGAKYSEAWNFGPNEDDAKSVEWLVKRICAEWGGEADYIVDTSFQPHEAQYLKLDCSKAKERLMWRPRWSLGKTIKEIIAWVQAYRQNADMREICLKQIQNYEKS